MSIRTAVVLVAGLLLAALLNGGVYTIVAAGSGGSGGSGGSHDVSGHTGDTGDIVAYRLNRFTGSITYCRYGGCAVVPVH